MNRELLERMYTYQRNLKDQLRMLEADGKTYNAATADVDNAAEEATIEIRTQQLNMLNSLIDLTWKPIESPSS